MLVRPQRGFRRLVQRRGFRRLRAAAVARVVGIFLHDKTPEHLNRCGFNKKYINKALLATTHKDVVGQLRRQTANGGGVGRVAVKRSYALRLLPPR